VSWRSRGPPDIQSVGAEHRAHPCGSLSSQRFAFVAPLLFSRHVTVPAFARIVLTLPRDGPREDLQTPHAAPEDEALRRLNTTLAAKVLDRHPALDLLQEPDGLLVRKPRLLHVRFLSGKRTLLTLRWH